MDSKDLNPQVEGSFEAVEGVEQQSSGDTRKADPAHIQTSSAENPAHEKKNRPVLEAAGSDSFSIKRAASGSPPTHITKRQKTDQATSEQETDLSSDDSSDDEAELSAEAKRESGAVIMPPGLPNPMPGKNPIRNDPALIARLGLDKSAEEYERLFDELPVYHLKKLDPKDRAVPKDFFALEPGTDYTVIEWIENRPSTTGTKERRTQNKRKWKIVEDKEWAHICTTDQSGIFVCDDVLEHMNKFSKAHIELCRSVRLEDPGDMCGFSYSAGPRDKPEFMVYRNLIKAKNMSEQDLRLHNHGLHSAVTLIWNLVRKRLPPKIIEPMVREMARHGMPRADWGMMGDKRFKPIVSTESRGQSHELTGLECGPPSAFCASMYARPVYLENAPEDAPLLSSLATEFTPGYVGGNFFMQSTNLKIDNAKNSLIMHCANIPHATTAHSSRELREHRGFSILTKHGLATGWQFESDRISGHPNEDKQGRPLLNDEQVEALTPREGKRYRHRLKARERSM